MTCEQIREQLVETARGRELSSDLRAIVFSHAAGCIGCAQRLEAERELSHVLTKVSVNTERAPARLEQLIARQLPVVSIRAARRPTRRRIWVPVAIAAAVSAVGFLAWNSAGLSSPAQRSTNSEAARENKPAAMAFTHVAEPVKTARTSLPLKARSHAAVSDHSPSEAADVGFVQLPYAEDLRPEETTEIMRVQLPRDSLAVLGLPVSGEQMIVERPGDSVDADVLIGMDGTARAIRLLE